MLFNHSTDVNDTRLYITNPEYDNMTEIALHMRGDIVRRNTPFDIDALLVAMAPYLLPWAQKHPSQRFSYHILVRAEQHLNWDRIEEKSIVTQHRTNGVNDPTITIYYPRLRTGYQAAFNTFPAPDAKEKGVITLLTTGPYHLVRLRWFPERNVWMIVTNKLNPEFLLRISYLLGYLFPEMDNPLAKELVPLIQQQQDKSFATKLFDFFQTYNEDAKQQQRLDIWRNAIGTLYTNRLARQEQTVQQHAQNTGELARRYRDALMAYQQELRVLNGIKYTGTDTDVEGFLDYIQKTPYIQKLTLLEANKIRMAISIPCRNFDPGIIKTMIDSNRASFFTARREAFKRIFLDETVKLYLGSTLYVDFKECDFGRAGDYGEFPYRTGIPSPHFYIFDCWGTNKHPIIDALNAGDYITAMTQILSAAGNLNFSEANNMETTFARAERGERGYTKPCIEVAPGKLLTWKQYLDYIKQEGQTT